jgi:hypothetical protein
MTGRQQNFLAIEIGQWRIGGEALLSMDQTYAASDFGLTRRSNS